MPITTEEKLSIHRTVIADLLAREAAAHLVAPRASTPDDWAATDGEPMLASITGGAA